MPRRNKKAPINAAWPTILCIDDDPQISESIRLRLRDYEVNVICGYFGMHGFHEAMTHKPDLIISDMKMPQGEGNVVVDCVRKNADTSHIPIVILTGQKDRPLEGQLRRQGVQDYLVKPVEFDELKSTISKYVQLNPQELAVAGTE